LSVDAVAVMLSRPTKRPSAEGGRRSDPSRRVPHVGDTYKGSLCLGRLPRI